MIPRWPNGATRRSVRTVILAQVRRQTLGTETSKYRQEEKSNEMPGVAASERGRAQTSLLRKTGVVGPTDGALNASRNLLERSARDGDSPVREAIDALVVFLSNARLE